MAPRKKIEKEEKATGAEGSDMILHYLHQTNRPYSAIDVSTNLHNKVTKAAAAKLLKDLHEQNKIEGRPAGKQIVYHALQNPDDAISAEQLAAYDARISNLNSQTADLQALAKTLRGTLVSLNSTLSTADMLSSILSLEHEKLEILSRLDSLKAGSAKKITGEERSEVEKEWNKMKGVAGRREKIAKDFFATVKEGTEGEEALEELRDGWGMDD